MLGPENLREGDLVAATLPPGPGWVRLVRGIWDQGAAILPIDPRLPQPERADLVARARPTLVVDRRGRRRLDAGEAVGRGTVLVVHTSGTAGAPKLVEFDRPAIEAAVASSALALGATDRDRWLCCLPLAHVGGLLVVLRAVLLGSPVVVHPGFDVTSVASEEAEFVSVVPTMLARLLDAGVDLSRFRAMLVGGGALRPDLRSRAERSAARVVETYGLTETCGGVVYDGLALRGTEIRIGGGGIELRGPTLMRGYLHDPERAAEALTPDGWLRSGDAGRLEDGRLRVIGRIDELINSGGEKVWPEEVEQALATHPKVADVAVAGRADPEWGQRVVAFVVPAAGTHAPRLDDLRDHASRTIARFKAPREMVLVDSLPRTPSGKVRRAALRRATE